MRDLGKIDSNKLRELFRNKLGKPSHKIIQGAALGVDTGVIQIDQHKSLVVASDPASFIPDLGIKESAWLTVVLTANDIATSGNLPQYAQFVLNLTHRMMDDEWAAYWDDIHQFCLDLGISITGGHTGFDDLGTSTLAGGVTMFTVADNTKIKCSSFAQPHQDLILTKSAAVSSAAILAKSFPHYTKEHLGGEVYTCLADSFYQTDIIREVKALSGSQGIFQKISAMHDITEGGSLGAVYELSEASQVGVKVEANKIEVGQPQREICELFQIDPLRSTGAGSLLLACEKDVSSAVLETLYHSDIPAAVVGETLPWIDGKKIVDSKGENELTYDEKDPYWEAFFEAKKRQLK